MQVEVWKDIVGYNGLYQVSNLGRVMGMNYKNSSQSHLITPQVATNGYLKLKLHKNGKRKYTTIHRLVAEHFIENPNGLPQVNHIDEDKTNNNVNNLEWCDAKYNSNYGTRNDKIRKKVIQLTLNGEFISSFNSTVEVQRMLGYKHQNISSCCRGEIKTVGGYKWKYDIK